VLTTKDRVLTLLSACRGSFLSGEELAQSVGVSRAAVWKAISALREAGLTERHARALLKLPGEPEKLAAIEVIRKQGLSVAAAEKYIESLLKPAQARPRQASVSSFLNNLTDSLAKIQSTGVKAVSERRETESQIVVTITIPK